MLEAMDYRGVETGTQDQAAAIGPPAGPRGGECRSVNMPMEPHEANKESSMCLTQMHFRNAWRIPTLSSSGRASLPALIA